MHIFYQLSSFSPLWPTRSAAQPADMLPLGVFAHAHQAVVRSEPVRFKDPSTWKKIEIRSPNRNVKTRELHLLRKAAVTTTCILDPSALPPALPAVTLGTAFNPFALSSSALRTSSASTAVAASSSSSRPPSRAKHVPIVIPNYESWTSSSSGSAISIHSTSPVDQQLALSNHSDHQQPIVDAQHSPQRSFDSNSKQKPRHVEIVIPEWAQPLRRSSDISTVTTSNHSSTPATPLARPNILPDMAHVPHSTSRTNTLDSNTSEPTAAQLHGGRFNDGSNDLMASANTSQSSLYQGMDNAGDAPPTSATTRIPGAGFSTAVPTPTVTQTAGLNSSPTSNNGRSGLVCNVYRTTGREPRPLVGATTTVLGDKLYVFGGRRLARTRPQLTSDLYELDLIRRHWTKLNALGDIPPPRYFHSVCPLGDSKLICYGGMSPAILPDGQPALPNAPRDPSDPQPEIVVMSDIHIYDIPTNTWSKIQTDHAPQGRYAHCATVLPSSAVFASGTAAKAAIHHNPSDGLYPNAGQIGISLDGSGGAEMIIVGGQDSANHYIEQISVFNLRSLKWSKTETLSRSCGAYRSIVAALSPKDVTTLGRGDDHNAEVPLSEAGSTGPNAGAWSMLIYSNYNFLDVKLELQVRSTDGTLTERPMNGTFTPPGLRFPNGGVINGHFVVCGTFLTSSKQEYALWALDLKSLVWSRIDTGPSNFSHGSWNRGVLWQRRNVFVILGNRKRSLVEDYNHRQINFTNVALVELESFGLYDNPRRVNPMTRYMSGSSPLRGLPLPVSLPDKSPSMAPNGRQLSQSAIELGMAALDMSELADMDLLALGGERVPVNSHVVAKRWGPYFNQLLREGIVSASADSGDTATLRPGGGFPSRNSIITITPSIRTAGSGNTTLVAGTNGASTADTSLLEPPDPRTPANPSNRPRTLFLPHTHLTIQALVHYLYTSTLPPNGSHLSTPQILCSLLQLARPYRVDGLLEAIIERLHTVLDGRNTAAIFNAAAMAAGGGDGVSFHSAAGRIGGALGADFDSDNRPGQRSGTAMGMATVDEGSSSDMGGATARARPTDTATRDRTLRINTDIAARGPNGRTRAATDSSASEDELSSAASERSDIPSGSEWSAAKENSGQPVWNGELSAVIGLQKRGLRGLMEGRRLREMGGREIMGSIGSVTLAGTNQAAGSGMDAGRVGLGIV